MLKSVRQRALVLKLFGHTRLSSHSASFAALNITLPAVKIFLGITINDENTKVGSTTSDPMKSILSFSFVFFCLAMSELFYVTNRLSEYLQGSKVNVAQALDESFTFTLQLTKMKSDMSDKFEEIYTDCVQFCTVYEFQLPSESVRKRVRDQEAIESDQKEHNRLKYDTLLATIIEEIRKRFDTHSYHPAIELFELIRCCNKTRPVDFEKLKIYDTVLDFTKLEVEFQGFIFTNCREPIEIGILSILLSHIFLKMA
jgi:hypothetical protein